MAASGVRVVRRHGWRGHSHGISDDSDPLGADRRSCSALSSPPLRSGLQLRDSLRYQDVLASPEGRAVSLRVRLGSGVARPHCLGFPCRPAFGRICAGRAPHRGRGPRQHHGCLHPVSRVSVCLRVPTAARGRAEARYLAPLARWEWSGPAARRERAYSHIGSAETLADLIQFYDGPFSIGLTDAEVADLVGAQWELSGAAARRYSGSARAPSPEKPSTPGDRIVDLGASESSMRG
jgi:hypothetical protein